MKVGVPKEVRRGERRVAATPETVGRLLKLGFEVLVEKDAGLGASFRDSDYIAQGAAIASSVKPSSTRLPVAGVVSVRIAEAARAARDVFVRCP